MTDSPVKHDRIFLDRVLQDIQDLLEYAAERTDLSKIDVTLLHDAAEVLRAGADRAAPGFAAAALGVLDRLTTAVRPATACGVRFARHVTREQNSAERRLLTWTRYKALLVLVAVFIIYGYIAYGQTIVRAIDTLRPQIDLVQDQLRTLIASADPPSRTGPPRSDETVVPPPGGADHRQPAQPGGLPPAAIPGEPAAPRAADAAAPPAQAAEDEAPPVAAAEAPRPDDVCTRTGAEKAVGAAWLRECGRLTEAAQNLQSQFNAAHDRLHDWRDALLSLPVFLNLVPRTDVVCFAEAGQLALYPHLPRAERQRFANIVTAREGGVLMRGSQCLGGGAATYAAEGDLTVAAYGFRQRHEQQARSIIDTVSLLILPGLFGLLGAMLAYVRELHHAMSEQRIDPAMFARSGLQLLLGTVLGALTGVLFSQSFMAENFGLERFAVAFFAGFSVETAFRFLQGILDRALRSATEDRREGRRGRPRRGRDPQEPSDDRPPGEGDRPRPVAVRG